MFLNMANRQINLCVIVPALLFTISCQNTTPANIVKFEPADGLDALMQYVEYIDVVPLRNDGEHYVGANPELLIYEDSYIVTDMFNQRIYRYSNDGRFLNQIGRKGNGPTEYQTIADIQLLPNGVLNVYSQPANVHSYTVEGDHISDISLVDFGMQVYHTDEGYLVYYGNGTGRDSRLSIIDGDNLNTLLEGTDKVLHYTSNSPVFSLNYDNSIAIIDSYNPIIYKYIDGKLTEYLEFDFNDTAVPSAYYEQESPFAAANFLLSRDFSMIRRYFESEKYKFVEIITNHPSSMPTFMYGLSKGDEWNWFSTGPVEEKPLTASFREIGEGDMLYAIVDPLSMSRCQPEILSKIRDSSIIGRLGQDDNYLVLKIQLK